MNKYPLSAMRKNAQAGFTLIELIVVIVILGILAATALPKFADLGKDARFASLSAVKGSMLTTSALVHGKWLIAPATTYTLEGVVVNVNATSGYPTADANLGLASGLNASDYVAVAPGSAATANTPVTSATEVAYIPKSVSGTPTGLTCFVKYTGATTANSSPTVTVPADNTSC